MPEGTYATIAGLPVVIEGYALQPMVRDTSSGFTKITTVVRLRGNGFEGLGEDVTWDQIDQIEFLRVPPRLPLRGTWTMEGIANALARMDLFPLEPCRPASRRHRRWAFESAALDLALQQAGVSLAEALGREPRPVRFVTSVRLGDPPSVRPILDRNRDHPDLGFKLDPTPAWDDGLVRAVAECCDVQTVDLKGHYRNANVEMAPRADLYERVMDAFPAAWLEDPGVTGETRALVSRHAGRVSWDEPVHRLGDLASLPFPPAALNIKPARMDGIRELFEVYDHCDATGIPAYGGGMFELGPGRGQLQYLASLFHPEGPNDLAPPAYNAQSIVGPLPPSPLPVAAHPTGFRWGEWTLRASIRDAAG